MMRFPLQLTLLGACVALLSHPVLAQSPGLASSNPGLGQVPSGLGTSGKGASSPQSDADPVVASVEGHLIYLSELGRASETLPENLRNLPFETLYPVLLDRMIDHQALVIMARRAGLEDQKEIQREIQASTEKILEGAYLAREAAPKVTETAIQARYNSQFANRPASEEVRARHILVTTEAEAKRVLEDLGKGADFATLARLVSKDPDKTRGGDLGFFRREQVWPSFADIAFSLQPGQIAPKPVHNEFGWHVVKVEERRFVAPPSYSDIHDQLKQELTADAIRQAVDQARGNLAIHRFNIDGSELETGPRLNMSGAAPAPVQSKASAPVSVRVERR